MEENSALKIRSDLYPMSSLVAYEMTSNNNIRDQNVGSELPFDLRTRTHSDTCANNDSESTKSDSHKKPANCSSTNGDLRHSPVCEPNENNQRTAVEIQSFNLTDKCSSGQPANQSNCVAPITSRESCLVFQERERPVKEIGNSPPTNLMDAGGERSSPVLTKDNEGDDDDDERIDVVTPDEMPLSKSANSVISSLPQPYHVPYMAPPEYLLPRSHESATSVSLQVQDSLLQSRNGPPVVPFQPLEVLARLHQGFESYDRAKELPESSAGTLPTAATLDLSTSSRSSSSSDHYNPSVQTPKLPLSPTPSPTPFNPFGVLPNFARLQELNPMFREGLEGALKPTYNPSLYSANLPPHLLPWLLQSQIQNLVQCQTRAESSRSIFGPYNGSIFTEEKDQQPLDLSAKKLPITPLSDEDLVSRVLEIKPSTRGRRRADNNKRTYTEDELHAALRDIQSGKLGTRRAAVIYGIPRSTLRNKVYKLQMERDRNKKLMEQNEKAASILPDSTHSGLLTFLSDSKTQQETASCEAFKSIIRSKMTEKLDELSKNNQAFLTGNERQRLLDSSFSYLFENIPKLALNLEKKAPPSEVLSSLSLYPQLNEFTHKIVEERFNEEINRTKNRINGSLIPNFTSSYKRDSSDDPEISVPSYPVFMSPSSHNDLIREDGKNVLGSSHASISSPQENLKDMIANMINQKMFNEESTLKSPASNLGPSETFLPISVQRLENSVIKSSQKLPSDERLNQDQSKKRAKSPSTNGGGKGSRPKRGKYRNYDRDNLLKAVQAVQSGEMSVHRAGSHYGVPHSTLEYKVKERHLHKNRPKKETIVQSNVQTLLRNCKDPASARSGTLLANSLSKDQYKTEIPDTTTLDISLTESRSNDDVSIISVQSSPKKFKHTNEKEDRPYSSSLSIPPNPFLSNPFPFWNNASPLLAPFLSNHYQTENLYTSQMMMDLQEKLGNSADSVIKGSPNRMEPKFSEIFSRESSLTNKLHHDLSNGGSITPSPPSSPPLNEGLLNSLLRKKIETASNESACHWQIPSVSAEQSQDGTKENVSETLSSQRLSPSQGPPTGFLTLNALLPSFLARSSLAAAAALSAENSSEQSPPQPAPLSLIKGVTHIPFVGSHLAEAP